MGLKNDVYTIVPRAPEPEVSCATLNYSVQQGIIVTVEETTTPVPKPEQQWIVTETSNSGSYTIVPVKEIPVKEPKSHPSSFNEDGKLTVTALPAPITWVVEEVLGTNYYYIGSSNGPGTDFWTAPGALHNQVTCVAKHRQPGQEWKFNPVSAA